MTAWRWAMAFSTSATTGAIAAASLPRLKLCARVVRFSPARSRASCGMMPRCIALAAPRRTSFAFSRKSMAKVFHRVLAEIAGDVVPHILLSDRPRVVQRAKARDLLLFSGLADDKIRRPLMPGAGRIG